MCFHFLIACLSSSLLLGFYFIFFSKEVVPFSHCGYLDRGASHSQLRHSFPLAKSPHCNLEIVHVYSIQTPLLRSTSAATALCVKRARHRRPQIDSLCGYHYYCLLSGNPS